MGNETEIKGSVADVLREFVRDIDQTGGVREGKNGFYAPVADPEWLDLARTYFRACGVLGHNPKIAQK